MAPTDTGIQHTHGIGFQACYQGSKYPPCAHVTPRSPSTLFATYLLTDIALIHIVPTSTLAETTTLPISARRKPTLAFLDPILVLGLFT